MLSNDDEPPYEENRLNLNTYSYDIKSFPLVGRFEESVHMQVKVENTATCFCRLFIKTKRS